MIQEANLELLRAIPDDKGNLILQYIWRNKMHLDACDIIALCEEEVEA